MLAGLLLVLLTGSIVYCILAMIGAARYRASGAPRLSSFPPLSVLRPLHGASDNTEANLRSLFGQTYPEFEVLLSVHEASDPAAAVARRVMAAYPNVPSELVIVEPSPYPNAKVWSLRALLGQARFESLLMSDSDISLEPDAFATIVSELEQPNVGLVTCPYRAVPGFSFWSKIEALGLNTEFLAGMLTARLLNGMDFAIGCTIATRRTDLKAIGGLEHLQRYLAEDFMMGNLVNGRGRTVILSRSVIGHHIGGDGFANNWGHRLRWARSTRRSRRMGYLGELFTKTYAISLAVVAAAPRFWPLALLGFLVRAISDRAVAIGVLNDPLTRSNWWLLPVEGVAGFVTWCLGFFGNSILWRGRKLILEPDGSFREQA